MKVKSTMTLPDTVQPNGDINVEDISTDIEIDLTGSLNDLRFAINPFKGNVDHFNMEVDGQTENVVGASGATIPETPHDDRDRKSTRLNSSHVAISYAVFCLK